MDFTSWPARFTPRRARLRTGGYLIFEFGFGQDVEIEALVNDHPDFELIGLRRDLQGIARTAVARRV